MRTQTRLAAALRQEAKDAGLTQVQLAARAGLTQGAISQLIGYGYRAAPSTLKRLATGWPDPDAGGRILAAHLLDEIQRAGHKPDGYEVRAHGIVIEIAPTRFEEDLSYLRETAQRIPVLQALIHDLATLTREELRRAEMPKLAAAEKHASYSTKKRQHPEEVE